MPAGPGARSMRQRRKVWTPTLLEKRRTGLRSRPKNWGSTFSSAATTRPRLSESKRSLRSWRRNSKFPGNFWIDPQACEEADSLGISMTEFVILLIAGFVVFLLVQVRRMRDDIEHLRQRFEAAERRNLQPEPPPSKVIPPSPFLVPPPFAPSLEEPTRTGKSQASPRKPPIDWEQFFGVKLFAWLGGLALFLGVAFLVEYLFENNLITPLARVAIGAACAL